MTGGCILGNHCYDWGLLDQLSVGFLTKKEERIKMRQTEGVGISYYPDGLAS